MKNYSIMLKPASSLCDLRCRYCFYADVAARRSVRSFGMMQDSVLRRIMENIARSVAPGDHITLMFQGGEPMLAGLDFFRTLTEIADSWPSGISVSYALQTNAMHLDEAWCLFLKKHEFLVGVSHDLLAAQHNAARVDASGAPTIQRVERSISLLRKHDIAFNVLCTLTNPLARHPQQVWKRIVQLNLPYVQFTPCLGFLEQTEKSPWAIRRSVLRAFTMGSFGSGWQISAPDAAAASNCLMMYSVRWHLASPAHAVWAAAAIRSLWSRRTARSIPVIFTVWMNTRLEVWRR